MGTSENSAITVQATVNASLEKTWRMFTEPEHIIRWYQAIASWHAPAAKNDLQPGGKFKTRMEARDGSFGFDFEGVYTNVVPMQLLEFTLGDNRKVKVTFDGTENQTTVTEIFNPETQDPVEMQRGGWQAILNSFKNYVEVISNFEPLRFEITINAPVEKVYKTMLDEKGYQEWTSAFNGTSRFVGKWEKGQKMKFLGTDEKGNTMGMLALLEEVIPNKFVSLEYIGTIDKDKEVTTGPDVEAWIGGHERYTFQDHNGKTKLIIDLDSSKEFAGYMRETYPKALEKLKALCES